MLIFNIFSIFTKVFSTLSSLFRLGKGTTFVSNYYLNFVKQKPNFKNFKFKNGVIFVTGTNGKTTTSKILAELLHKTGNKVLHNKTGGNILRSITGMFLLENKFFSKNNYDYLVLEIDEASLEIMSKLIKPTHLILLNFSRDQLDRYFEIENISNSVIKILEKNPKLTLVYNKEDLYCQEISQNTQNNVVPFFTDFKLLAKTNYNESFMAGNIKSVVETLTSLGIGYTAYERYLKQLEKPYGRGEKIVKDKREFEIHLAKNPESFNHNLVELQKRKNLINFMIVLNDEIPDGTDISWIYDIDSELLDSVLEKKKIYFSGSRAFEMAARVNYAVKSCKFLDVNRNLKKSLIKIKEDEVTEVIVLCNYSAMLQLRKLLTGRKID